MVMILAVDIRGTRALPVSWVRVRVRVRVRALPVSCHGGTHAIEVHVT